VRTIRIVGDGTDADTLRWALSLEAEIVEEADICVVAGNLDDDTYAAVKDSPSLVILCPLRANFDRKWLGLDALWLIRNRRTAAGLLRGGSELRIASIGWSSPEPVRREPYELPAPTIATGVRGRRVPIPLQLAHRADEHEPATALIAPTDASSTLKALHRGIPIVDFPGSLLLWAFSRSHDGLVLSNRPNLVAAILGDEDRLRRRTCPQPGAVEARREAFLRELHWRVLKVKPKTIRFVNNRPNHPIIVTRRRFETLLDFGFCASTGPAQTLATEHHDFVLLGGRVPPSVFRAVAKATKKPLVFAMNDALCDAERIRWFRDAARFASVMFVSDPPDLLPSVDCKVVQLHQPPNVISSVNGPLVRHPLPPISKPDPDAPDVIFLAHHWYKRRIQIIRNLATVATVQLHGHRIPSIPNTSSLPPVVGEAAMQLMRRAKVTLSTSISNDRELTSVRLFNATAVGAYVLAERFPNCEDLFPEGMVRWFTTPKDAARVLREMLDTPFDEVKQARWAAMERTWRYYSHHDRIRTLLHEVQNTCAIPLLIAGAETGYEAP